MDEFSNSWLVVGAEKAGVRQKPPEQAGVRQQPAEELETSEIPEFAKLFKNSKAPKILEAELPPGETRGVELELTSPSGLAGSVQWIGTAAALKTTIVVNGSPLVTGTPYRIGTRTGGSTLQAQTPVGGRAILAVTNTSNMRVKVRILLVATAR